MTTTWTLKAPDKLDRLVKEAINKFGYTSKGELIREAVRCFLLERNIYFLLGNVDEIQPITETPLESLTRLRRLDLSEEELNKALSVGREQIEDLIREVSDED